MNILVTGGAGFIGSHIASVLLEAGHTVTVIDNLDPYYNLGIKERNIENCREIAEDQYTFVEGSITDEALVFELVADHDIEYIYHQAAQAGVRTSVEDPKKPHEINTTGLLNLLITAEKHDVNRFINASSSSVYGKMEYLPYDEDHQNLPQSPYGVTKLTAEHYCRVWNEIYDLPTVSLRYFTVYGPRMRPNMAITNFVSRCLNGKPPEIYGDGSQSRDFTHIDDVVQANLALLDTDAADGEALNIGSTDNIDIETLAETVRDQIDPSLDLVYGNRFEADAEHTHANVSKARRLIDYEPSTSIEEGVSQFIDWYKQNQDWYEPLVLNS